MIREQIYRNEHYRTLKYVSKIMAIIFLLWFAITFLARVRGSDERLGGSSHSPQLEILPDVRNNENMLHKRVFDSLNLTCRINWRPNGVKPHPKFNISWIPPSNEKGSSDIHLTAYQYISKSLYIAHLQESHSGEYKCVASEVTKTPNEHTFQTSVQVFVLKNCSQKMFECPSKLASPSHCIFKRYVCDGKQDCANGEDESANLANCDPVDPCKDKLLCDDGRCIPHSWCCPTNSKLDCNITYPFKECCRRMNDTLYPLDPLPNLKGLIDETEPPSLNQMGFLQTTIVTVIGCAMAFMVIVTILVIAICRVHMKRTLIAGATISPGAHVGVSSHRGMGRIPQQMYDVDLFFGHTRPGLLVTYNINNGVQFVGRPVDPPPYSEVVSTPPREGPPPPYVSHENLARTVASEDLSRITSVEDDSEDNGAHESDALLSVAPATTPVYSLVGREEPVIMSSCSTQTGNLETRRSMRSLLAAPITVDAGTQVSSLSDGYGSSPSVSVERLDRPSISMIPPVLRDTSVGRLRESFIGLRERGKDEPVIVSISKPACALECRPPRSGSRDRSET